LPIPRRVYFFRPRRATPLASFPRKR